MGMVGKSAARVAVSPVKNSTGSKQDFLSV
jgi:hypothetical protein